MSELEVEQLLKFVEEVKDTKFSLGEIIETWGDSYGENIVLEYSGFIKNLLENESN